MGTAYQRATASLTGTSQQTDPLTCLPGDKVAISISGTFTATAMLQRRLDGSNWHNVPNPDDTFGWTSATEKTYDVDSRQEVRVACTAYTSGTIEALIQKG